MSCDSKYRFHVEDPFPEDENNLAEAMANTTYQFSIVGRSHLHQLIDNETDEAAMERYIADHREELEADLADLFNREISEEVFAEAFLRGVRKSRVRNYEEEDIIELGKQFHKDVTLFKPEEEQREIFRGALILVSAVGRLYIGRADRKKDSDNTSGGRDADTDETVSMSEDKKTGDEKREFTILQALKKGYETGDFEDAIAYLTDDSIFKSQWVVEQLTGKDAITEYLRGKGQTLKRLDAFAFGDYIVCPDGIILRITQKGENDEDDPIVMGVVVSLDSKGMIARIDLCDILPFLDSLEEDE